MAPWSCHGAFSCPRPGCRGYAERVPPAPPIPPRGLGRGLGFAIGSYAMWGILPLYFLLLAPTGPFEVVALRIVLSLAFCALLLTVMRGWRAFWNLATQPRVLGIMAIAERADLHQLAGLHLRGPQRPRRRSRHGLLHQPDHHRRARGGVPARTPAGRAVGGRRHLGRRHPGHRDRLRRLPVDRPLARLLVRAVRLHQEARGRPGGCRERDDDRDRAAASGGRRES